MSYITINLLTDPYIALLCVCDGFTLHRRNLAWEPPCSVLIYRGTGNRVWRISVVSDTGAASRFLKFSYSGCSWYPAARHCAIVWRWKYKSILWIIHYTLHVTEKYSQFIILIFLFLPRHEILVIGRMYPLVISCQVELKMYLITLAQAGRWLYMHKELAESWSDLELNLLALDKP